MSIVVIGTSFVDIKGYPYGEYIANGRNSGYIEEKHGGVARNMVEDIANVELRPIFVSLVDKTGSGLSVLNKLQNHKVNTDYVLTVPDGMGTWLAVFDQSGDVIAQISKRSDSRPILETLKEKGDEIFAQADSILLEFDMDKDVISKVFELADAHNVPVYAGVSNMTIAVQRRDFIRRLDTFICNIQEAGILFFEDYSSKTPDEMQTILKNHLAASNLKRIVVTMGDQGAVYVDKDNSTGHVPATPVIVKDTTGAGDAFASGVVIGLTYGKTLAEACGIGVRLAASVICSVENVCPRFQPEEFGIEFEEVK